MQVKLRKIGDPDDELTGDLLWSPAQVIFGSRLEDEQLLQAALEMFPDKRVSIVRHWMLIDLVLTAHAKRHLESRGLKPMVLYANTVVGAPVANEFGVLSGYLRCYEDCFVETPESFFVLAGQGSRKQAPEDAVQALARRCGIDL
jgi:hypothetical protein